MNKAITSEYSFFSLGVWNDVFSLCQSIGVCVLWIIEWNTDLKMNIFTNFLSFFHCLLSLSLVLLFLYSPLYLDLFI